MKFLLQPVYVSTRLRRTPLKSIFERLLEEFVLGKSALEIPYVMRKNDAYRIFKESNKHFDNALHKRGPLQH